MKKIVLTGASGMLGAHLFHTLKTSYPDSAVIPCAHRPRPGFINGDFAVPEFSQQLALLPWDTLIHCAAFRDPGFCETHIEETYRVNTAAPVALAKIAADRKAVFLFISTDYVFDGRFPPYHESDPVRPLNAYGQSKADAEKEILNAYPNAIILRVPLLWGLNAGLAQCPLLSGLLTQILAGKPEAVNHTAVRFPTWTGDVAQTVLHLCTVSGHRGIFHCSAQEGITRYGIALMLGELLSLRTDHLTPDVTIQSQVNRPQNAHLISTRIPQQDFIPFKTRLSTFLPHIYSGKS